MIADSTPQGGHVRLLLFACQEGRHGTRLLARQFSPGPCYAEAFVGLLPSNPGRCGAC